VRYRWLAITAGYRNLKHAVLILRHRSSVAVPIVEVTDEVGTQGIGRPFTVHNVAVVDYIEAVLLVSLRQQLAVFLKGLVEDACPRKFLETTFCVLYRLQPLLSFCVAAAKGGLEWVKIGVELAHACKTSVHSA